MDDLEWLTEDQDVLSQPIPTTAPVVKLEPYVPLTPFQLNPTWFVCQNCARGPVNLRRCQNCLLLMVRYSRQLEVCIDDRPSSTRRAISSYNEISKTFFFTLHFDRVIYNYDNPETVESKVMLINETDYASFRYQLIQMKNPLAIQMRNECHYEATSSKCLTHRVSYPHCGGLTK